MLMSIAILQHVTLLATFYLMVLESFHPCYLSNVKPG